jgi:hypothetical protein
LRCFPMSQFSKGGELFRVVYPHWVCQCYVPASSTTKPHIAEEHFLEPQSPDAVAKRANSALRAGNWAPLWSQSSDIEFCIQTKIGSSPPVELHSRKTLSSSFQWPFGCAIGGERKPSLLFGVGRSAGAGAGGASAPPGYAAKWDATPPVPSQAPAVSLADHITDTSRFPQQGYPPQPMWGALWSGSPGGWEADSVGQPTAAAAQASSKHQFSVTAQEFVPGGAPPGSFSMSMPPPMVPQMMPPQTMQSNFEGLYQ